MGDYNNKEDVIYRGYWGEMGPDEYQRFVEESGPSEGSLMVAQLCMILMTFVVAPWLAYVSFIRLTKWKHS